MCQTERSADERNGEICIKIAFGCTWHANICGQSVRWLDMWYIKSGASFNFQWT